MNIGKSVYFELHEVHRVRTRRQITILHAVGHFVATYLENEVLEESGGLLYGIHQYVRERLEITEQWRFLPELLKLLN